MDQDPIDLMLTVGDRNMHVYEPKFNLVTESEFKDHLYQSSKCATFVNLHPEGPDQLLDIIDNVHYTITKECPNNYHLCCVGEVIPVS